MASCRSFSLLYKELIVILPELGSFFNMKSKSLNNQRQSNMELLRIVAMLAVIAVHLDGASLGLPHPVEDITSLSAGDWWRLFVEAITIVGVNCFTLISGYFGIRSSIRGFAVFFFQCIFYSVGICTVMMLVRRVFFCEALCLSDWIDSWLIFTHNDLWYVPAYLGLYLMAPFLECGLNDLSKRRFTFYLAAFVLFNVYCGWIWRGTFNPTGYTILHLVMMYLIGRYIGKFITITEVNRCKIRMYSCCVYCVATILITLMATSFDTNWVYAYNSPLVLASSIALFMLFATLRFSYKWINFIASSAFAAYLIHKNPYVWRDFIKPSSIYLWEGNSLLSFTLLYLLFVLLIFAVCVIVDILRRAIFARIGLTK